MMEAIESRGGKMAIKRVMGIETEYGIIGRASEVLSNCKSGGKRHENHSETNKSAVEGMEDRGHFAGDYKGQEADEGVVRTMGFSSGQTWGRGYDSYYGYGKHGYYGCSRDEMLANGARFYIDMGHPEYSTPEASNPIDAVIADKAGERILERASESGDIARIFKNNVDIQGHSYGTHENYLVDRRKARNFKNLARFMIPFFISRIAFTGAGRIGFRDEQKGLEFERTLSHVVREYGSLRGLVRGDLRDLYNRTKELLDEFIFRLGDQEMIYQLSQRADFFKRLVGLQTTYNRPIINTRDEALSDSKKYMRFHVICGDANLSETATYLKLGITALVLDLYEDRLLKPFKVRDPVKAFHLFSRDPGFKTRVKTWRYGEMTALDIQRVYLEAAESAYRGRDGMTDDILDRWGFVLGRLEEDPMQLDRMLDWVIKKRMIDAYREEKNLSLFHPYVRNIDLIYHEINMEKGLFYIMQRKGLVDRLVDDEDIEYAVENPPKDTRAWVRGELIRRGNVSSSDWDKISVYGENKDVILDEPLEGTREELKDLFDSVGNDKEMMRGLEALGYLQRSFSGYGAYRSSYGGRGGKKRQEKIESGREQRDIFRWR